MSKFDIYRGKRVLITGHTGVKGSWAAQWLTKLGATVMGISHPPRSTPNHYKLLDLNSRMETDWHTDISLVKEINSLKPDIVFHFAAKAIVARTFTEPEATFYHTVMGAVHILELCRQCPSVKGVVAVLTDKIYENKEWNYAYRENDEMGGIDPYSASKVCVEQVVRCYRESFGMNIAVGRAGNILAGGDWSEKRLIPDMVRAASQGLPSIIHTPYATRPFQHALEAISGYFTLGQAILEGRDVNRAFNFGPDEGEMTVLEVLEIGRSVWPAIRWEVDNAPTHPHMVYLLKIDSTEARKILGWAPQWSMQEAVRRSVNWYKSFYERGEISTDLDIEMYSKGL